ncbi:MAG TPA: TetR/AcrR family transcriptional regulator [Blastocatellia bacterium]|nr:TetR/AcrR family transcriptional regulator [Blastocatellia bacterium]
MQTKHKITVRPDELPDEKNRNGKSETILRAAAKVFAQSGYFNSKVSDVARSAGVADGTVYLYFKNKDDLLTSIFSWAMGEFLTRARTELAEIANTKEKLLRFAKLHFSLLEQERDIAIVFQIELRQSTKFMEHFSKTYLAAYLQMLREIIEEGQKSGLLRSTLNAKLIAKLLFGMLDEMATNWVLSHGNHSLTEMAEPVLDIFFNGANASHV